MISETGMLPLSFFDCSFYRDRAAPQGRDIHARLQSMRTVVFDLDGTLADTSGDLLNAANICFRDDGHGDLLGPADAGTAMRGGRAMLTLGWDRVGRGYDEADLKAGYARLVAAYALDIATHSRMYPGAVEAVQALREAGFATAICTNKPEALAETLMQRLGVRHLFGALIGADTLPTRKPHPAPYVVAVERAGGAVARSMMVGDTDTDRQTGAAAGVPVALVTFGPEGDTVSRFAPEALLHHFDDLPDLAARLLR
jgi:phosphoglycolate phosphatase